MIITSIRIFDQQKIWNRTIYSITTFRNFHFSTNVAPSPKNQSCPFWEEKKTIFSILYTCLLDYFESRHILEQLLSQSAENNCILALRLYRGNNFAIN